MISTHTAAPRRLNTTNAQVLGRLYAAALVDSGVQHDVIFGPAYKGIPIAVATAVALAEFHDKDVPYCFNRKEAKDHGEGGNLVGHPLSVRTRPAPEDARAMSFSDPNSFLRRAPCSFTRRVGSL